MRAPSLLLILELSAALSVVLCVVIPLERAFPLNGSVELSQLVARDQLRHSRILQGLAGGVVDFSVQGSSDLYSAGLYFTKVKLGSPPREFNVQIDTGSDILWVTCSSCTNCPQSSELGIELSLFDSSSSSSAKLVSCSDAVCSSEFQTTATQCSQSNQCTYSFQYGDGSGTSGYYVADMLYFDAILGQSLIANSSALVVFGCSTYQSGDLAKTDKAVDGIFGFGQGDLSVISQLSSRGITPRVFSHCLKGDNSGGGIMVLGEILEPSIVYSPLVPSQPHYNLILQSIAVNGQLLQIDPGVFATSNNRGTIVDTGTTLAYLVQEAYDPFVSAITATVSPSVTPTISKGNQCYLVPTSVSELFPPVSLNFAGGASMMLKPEDYLIHQDGGTMWCIGFQKVQGGMSILGDIVLKDKIFVYDLAHQRIGWANYDCSSSLNVSITSSKDFINEGQLSVTSSTSEMLFKLMRLSFVTFLIQLLEFVEFQFL
ncbi:aspartyl protease family protein [Hibiscus syriacus]|uniref:Aspartyl protease family protein n=1 Tax=Hibiscus syriacus TaxID=106335 RepID=A0A6A3C2S4_HIBSY|nr:aspartic proteinase 39-like [Hibiscus syriacus]KAE8721908.1 aspartyl protease family protein [Hibiscus syriacus]